SRPHWRVPPCPTRRSSDLAPARRTVPARPEGPWARPRPEDREGPPRPEGWWARAPPADQEAPARPEGREGRAARAVLPDRPDPRSEEHTSELQSRENLVCP